MAVCVDVLITQTFISSDDYLQLFVYCHTNIGNEDEGHEEKLKLNKNYHFKDGVSDWSVSYKTRDKVGGDYKEKVEYLRLYKNRLQ